ncbi:hypothetical protein DFP93_11615 [Aneurinibacillus soli]|uniref:Uncharacterized protein n=1 Tax=Aneurinibacillus soli TaxID=1500254 RepID=A0A0U5BCL1_9BACL|nr:DUF309 domain-containing protein [Aneurinibacillus soli]PYE59649.1 hypothetical protein DFP93_11615 [Aneurinibacillus soli]BAU29350.1 hypothetical protein CB4_03537 [Aneurinibacillus soli]
MYDRLYVEYVYYFNVEKDYYECHEVMEEYWMQEGRNKLLQALLQVAVALHHFRNNNVEGAILLFEAALAKASTPWHGKLGIDDRQLFAEAAQYVERLHNYEENPFPFYPLTLLITDPDLAAATASCAPSGVAEEDKF